MSTLTYSKQTLSQLPTETADGIDFEHHDRPARSSDYLAPDEVPHFERYWVIEDVRYSGDWRELFDDLIDPRPTCS